MPKTGFRLVFINAYSYESNKRTVRCFKKAGFDIEEKFEKDGVWSFLFPTA